MPVFVNLGHLAHKRPDNIFSCVSQGVHGRSSDMVCVLFPCRKDVSLVHVWTEKRGRGDRKDRLKACMPLSR